MSFLHVSDKFEDVTSYLRHSLHSLRLVSNVFNQVKKASSVYANSMLRISQTLQSELQSHQSEYTITQALVSLKNNFKAIGEYLNSFQQQELFSELENDTEEPLNLFIEQYSGTNNNLINRGQFIIKRLQKTLGSLEKAKNAYYFNSQMSDQLQFQSYNEPNNDKADKLGKQANQQRNIAAKSQAKYMKLQEEAEKIWMQYDTNMPDIMEQIQQSEQSRIQFMKVILDKYYINQQIWYQSLLQDPSYLRKAVDQIDSQIDISQYIQSLKSQPQRFVREYFKSYDDWKALKRPEAVDFTNVSQAQISFYLISKVLSELIPQDIQSPRGDSESLPTESDEVTPAEYARVNELLYTIDGWSIFCDILFDKAVSDSMSEANFMQLVAMINSVLTTMMMESVDDPISFYKIITISQKYFFFYQGEKKYLNSYIANHNIWRDKNRWIKSIETTISDKILNEKRNVNRFQLGNKKNRFISKIKKWRSVFTKDSNEKQYERSSYFDMLSQYIFHMINLGLPIELASEIVLEICQKIQLDIDRTCILMAELQANQRNIRSPLEGPQTMRKSLKQRSKFHGKWGPLFPIGMAIDYLTPEESQLLLMVNKQWRAVFYTHICKKLLRSGGEDIQYIRGPIWKNLLNINEIVVDYNDLLHKVNADHSLIDDLYEIISMDVVRSYKNNPNMNSTALQNILNAYAIYNLEVGYCQGMNYIAGTFYLQMRDEQMAFKCLIQLIRQYQLTYLFTFNLPKLKLLFYQLDRIIGILLPEIHRTFKAEMISSSHFASPWFVTLFSSILQNKIDVLLLIWDQFLLDKWKVIFKVAVAILDALSGSIVNCKFEDIMCMLTSFTQISSMFNHDFVKSTFGYKVTNSLLRDLESEYETLANKARMTIGNNS